MEKVSFSILSNKVFQIPQSSIFIEIVSKLQVVETGFLLKSSLPNATRHGRHS